MNSKEQQTHLNTQTKIRAIVQDSYGALDVLRVEQIDMPTIEANEILIRVRAAGIDRGTWHLMTGKPYLMRLMGFGFNKPKNRVPGLDVAGTVAAIGANATQFSVGDEVFGIAKGSFAEYAVANQDKVALKPKNLTFEQSAVVPVSGLTALQALRDAGRIQPGQTVLVIGASGGVGTYAVQLAKALGASEVTGVASTTKLDLITKIGADHALDYTNDDFTNGSRRYDLIIDIGGNTRTSRLRQALTPTGTLVIVGGENKGSVTGGFGRSMRAAVKSLFVSQRLVMHMSKETAVDLEPLRAFIETGHVTPVVDTVYPLSEVADAMRHLVSGTTRGKLALVV